MFALLQYVLLPNISPRIAKKKGFFKIHTTFMQKIAKFQKGIWKIIFLKVNKMANFNSVSKEVYGNKFRSFVWSQDES